MKNRKIMQFIEVEKSVREYAWALQNLHSHPHYELYYLSKGSRTFLLPNALYHLTAPFFIIIPPHVMHKTEGGAFERYNINVETNYLNDYQKEIFQGSSLKIFKPSEKQNEEFIKLFDTLIQTDRHKKHGEHIFQTVFSYCTYLLSQLQQTTPPATVREDAVPPLVLKVMDYLSTYYSEKQTLDELAQIFFVSKATLMYNFKKHMHCSPIDFLLNVRLTKAKELLLRTQKSIGEISELCGFSSANYFGLIFKQKEHLSPANYRKHEWNKS